MTTQDIQNHLFEMQDIQYRDFQKKLLPTVKAESVIGVRTPLLRKFAKKLFKSCDYNEFLCSLPHIYFDENQLHAFIISEIKDYDSCICEIEQFLPFVDNWATTDQMNPKVLKQHKADLLQHIKQWIISDKTYTIRFGVGMLLQHFLDDEFNTEYLDMAASIRSEEYYVRMMVAWYIATALAKQYDAALTILTEHRLDTWTHNKAIQKAIESYRITDEQKAYLKTLKTTN